LWLDHPVAVGFCQGKPRQAELADGRLLGQQAAPYELGEPGVDQVLVDVGGEVDLIADMVTINPTCDTLELTWTAPGDCVDYFITVTVADDRGGEVSQELKIMVRKPG